MLWPDLVRSRHPTRPSRVQLYLVPVLALLVWNLLLDLVRRPNPTRPSLVQMYQMLLLLLLVVQQVDAVAGSRS
jgi:hypothetical protein